MIDGRTREARAMATTRADLERRLGSAPSFEARQVAEQIIRCQLDIALLERKRHEHGPLGCRDHELLVRRENALARLLERLERLAPPAAVPGLAEQWDAAEIKLKTDLLRATRSLKLALREISGEK